MAERQPGEVSCGRRCHVVTVRTLAAIPAELSANLPCSSEHLQAGPCPRAALHDRVMLLRHRGQTTALGKLSLGAWSP
jgi:hypothetical protein